MTQKDLETLKSYLHVKKSNCCSFDKIDIDDIVDFMRINCFEEPIDETELDKLANDHENEYTKEDYEALNGTLDNEWCAEINGKTEGFIDGFKAGYRKAKQE